MSRSCSPGIHPGFVCFARFGRVEIKSSPKAGASLCDARVLRHKPAERIHTYYYTRFWSLFGNIDYEKLKCNTIVMIPPRGQTKSLAGGRG
jgi:hypothetical protein